MGIEEKIERARRAGELLETAALSQTPLHSVFGDVAALFDAQMFQLFNFTDPSAPDLVVSPAAQQVRTDYILQGWHQHDIYSHRAGKRARHGLLINDRAVVTDHERAHDPFYQEFMRKHSMGAFVSWTFDLNGEKWAYTLMPPKSDPWDADTIAAYHHFMPLADRAALLATQIKEARLQGVVRGVELSGRPAVFLDQHARVVFVTRAAENLLKPDFCIRGGRLHAVHRETDAALRQLEQQIRLGERMQPVNFLIHRAGHRSILAMPVAVRDAATPGLPGIRLVLMLNDPEMPGAGLADQLRGVFHLTPREAELAARLASGERIETVAQAMMISTATARHMLKAVFAKTGVQRQAELAALASRLSP